MMKKIQTYKLLSLTLLLLSSNLVNATISLGFGTAVQNGSSIDMVVTISGLGNGVTPSLAAYDLDINFDSNHLAFSSATFGDAILGNQLDFVDYGFHFSEASLSETGVLNIYEISDDDIDDLNDFQADDFTLLTLTFNILKSDVSQLSLSINDLGDTNGDLLSATLNTGHVSTVPVPAAFWLMVSGLAVLYRKR